MPTSKTPLFDAALDAYYQNKQPGTFTCKETGEAFEITPKEFELYKLLRVPLPSVTSRARLRRLRASIAGLDLFRRTLPDGTSVVSMFDPESPIPLFHAEDEWDETKIQPLDYGRVIDPARSFFEQWSEFSRSVPRPAIAHNPSNERSEWSVYSHDSKDCYFTYGDSYNERMIYVDQSAKSTDCVDVFMSMSCSWSYDCIQCSNSSNLAFCDKCDGCMDTFFCSSCNGCTNCFGCTNLRQKKYCFLNEQLTEEEYKTRVGAIDLRDARMVEEWKKRIQGIWESAWHAAGINPGSEDVEGDNLHGCHDMTGVYAYECERVLNGYAYGWSKDCADGTSMIYSERCYNSVYQLHGSENKIVNNCQHCIDVEYSTLLASCEHCFGCIGLHHKTFCVFNKQYTEEEYWPLVDAIKTEMLKRGEYGEFFPYSASPCAYNTSHSDPFFPLTKEEAQRLGARWYDFAQERALSASPIEELPLHLNDVTDDVLQKAFKCPQTSRVWRFVKPELAFHRTMGIALPRIHPTARRKERIQQNFPIYLFPRTCGRCGKAVKTRIPPTSPIPLACEECYTNIVGNDEVLIIK